MVSQAEGCRFGANIARVTHGCSRDQNGVVELVGDPGIDGGKGRVNGHEVEPSDHVPPIVLVFERFVDQVKYHNYSNSIKLDLDYERFRATLTLEYQEECEWND